MKKDNKSKQKNYERTKTGKEKKGKEGNKEKAKLIKTKLMHTFFFPFAC